MNSKPIEVTPSSLTSEQKISRNTDIHFTVSDKTNAPLPPSIPTNPIQPFLNHHIAAANSSAFPDHTYCYRHNPQIKCNKEADAERMTEIQAQIEQLPSSDKKAISNVWSVFLAAPNSQRTLILKGILSQCCFHQLSFLSSELQDLIKIDFIATLPTEISLKILCYLDCASLCNAAQVSSTWKRLADDDRVWHHLCKQHIDRKCPNCGWGLPLLYMKRARERGEPEESQAVVRPVEKTAVKRPAETDVVATNPKKRRTRPWKLVYSERFMVERNWRKGHYKVKKFEGHSDGVICLLFDHRVLLTGSYDLTVKIWDIKTCKLIRTLVGHERGVKSIFFDGKKIVTGSLDCTIRIWNPTSGECVSTYRGHTAPVTSVDATDKLIVSGLADGTIKIWDVETHTCHTLRGHTDWVNSVKIHAVSGTILSCSDDCSIRVWCLKLKKCLKEFSRVNGHIGQVQCAIPLSIKDPNITEDPVTEEDNNGEALEGDLYPTHVLSCGLDNQIKLWNFRTGCCVRTQFGHVEGVWSVSADNFRIVSGSHDKSVKLWDLQTGKCMFTFGGHHSASVSCVKLGDSRFAAGDDSGMVKMYCFDE